MTGTVVTIPWQNGIALGPTAEEAARDSAASAARMQALGEQHRDRVNAAILESFDEMTKEPAELGMQSNAPKPIPRPDGFAAPEPIQWFDTGGQSGSICGVGLFILFLTLAWFLLS